MTMLTLYLPLAVFSFSEVMQFASKLIIISHYSRICTHFFKKTKPRISHLLSQNSERARSSQIWNERDAFACFGELRLVISHRGIPITQALK